MSERANQSGITLIEVLVGLALLVVLGLMAVPSWTEFQERQRLKAAAETLASSLNLARSEALAQQKFAYVQLLGQGSERWCYAVSTTQNCDCQAACPTLQKMEGQQWPGVSLTAAPKGGTAPVNVNSR